MTQNSCIALWDGGGWVTQVVSAHPGACGFLSSSVQGFLRDRAFNMIIFPRRHSLIWQVLPPGQGPGVVVNTSQVWKSQVWKPPSPVQHEHGPRSSELIARELMSPERAPCFRSQTPPERAAESQVASTPTGFQETLAVLRSPHFLLNIQSLGGESQGGPHSLPHHPQTYPGEYLCVHRWNAHRDSTSSRMGWGERALGLVRLWDPPLLWGTLHTHSF